MKANKDFTIITLPDATMQEYLNIKIKEHNRSLNKIILGSGYPESVYDIMR